MKHSLIYLTLISAMFSCATLQSAREKLESMPQEKFDRLVMSVNNAAGLGGILLKRELSEPQRAQVSQVVTALIVALQSGDVTLGASTVMDRILGGKPLDPDPVVAAKMKQALADAVSLVEDTVGQLRVDITGSISTREKALLLAILTGVRDGLL